MSKTTVTDNYLDRQYGTALFEELVRRVTAEDPGYSNIPEDAYGTATDAWVDEIALALRYSKNDVLRACVRAALHDLNLNLDTLAEEP